jgi:hypothetical protein
MTKLKLRLGAGVTRSQQIIDTQVMKDSTPYVPFDTGTLANSVILGTDVGSGTVRWSAVYAEAQYKGMPNKSKAAHPLATTYWFEAAKAVNKDKWIRVAKAAANL